MLRPIAVLILALPAVACLGPRPWWEKELRAWEGATLTEVGWIVGTYGFVWGGSQLFTGRLSDHVGRFWPNVLGMWICGAGVAMVVMGTGALWWSVSAKLRRGKVVIILHQ